MAISVCEVSLTESVLLLPESQPDAEAGAVVVFWGAVRALEEGRELSGIEYEAHRAMAEHQMRMVAESASRKFETRTVFLRHRIGWVPVGEPSVVVRVSAGHRGPAFAACQWIMDELKRVVPIWKRPVFRDSMTPGNEILEEEVART
jgi:molybdopterin synthase catalytic subunit